MSEMPNVTDGRDGRVRDGVTLPLASMTALAPVTFDPAPSPTDDEIVRRVVAGDVGAYRMLVDRHYQRCLRFGMRMLGNREDAEEAVQNAFVRAFGALGRYDARSRFEPWLFQILANQCRTLGAKRRRRERTFVPYDVEHDFGEPPAAAGVHRATDVRAALQQLAPDHREALLLKYMDDRSYEDMADLTGVGISALKMRVKRAREQLQQLLKGDYETEGRDA
jgi:RNA polymerase sigma-70 factor, ECF subfamily